MADDEVEEFFREQLEADELNRQCCDGGSDVPGWASVSHGIYISIGAAGVHRSLGVRVSRVQSLEMDAWKPLHLRMMELGGNRRFAEFLRSQGVPEDAPIRAKYATRAAAWYRRALEAEAQGMPLPEALPPGTGALPAEEEIVSPKERRVLDEVFAVPSSGTLGTNSPPSGCIIGPGLRPVGLPLETRSRCDESSGLVKSICASFKAAFSTGRPSGEVSSEDLSGDSRIHIRPAIAA